MTTAEAGFTNAKAALDCVRQGVKAVILGQDSVIDELLCGLFARGHVLIEGLPGQGKTRMAKSFAACLGLEFSRIQCTPDLLPADITGSEVLGADKSLVFRPGPLFSPIVLVDEINRATPRTQSAFLEAMQEQQVTCLGRHYPLPHPFWILATQNPIELEGTYPLPEAQLDRFAMKINVPFPARETLNQLADAALDTSPTQPAQAVDRSRVDLILEQVDQIIVADTLRDVAVALILDLQPNTSEQHSLTRQHIRYGASPRALQTLLRCARAAALMHGRRHVALTDLRFVALPVLRHRLLLGFESEVAGIDIEDILKAIIEARLK